MNPEVEAHAVIHQLQQIIAAQALELAMTRAMLAARVDAEADGTNSA